jgi:putative DNA primase/helicase
VLPQIDFARIARVALDASDRLLARWLPDGRKVNGEWQAKNPTRDDRHAGSFSVSITKGAWSDFATGDKGGDLISLYAYLHSLSMVDAAKEVADQLNINPEVPDTSTKPEPAPKREVRWVPVVPAPQGEAPPMAHRHRGLPERIWTYRGLDGAVIGFVYRFQTSDGGKEIIPLVWARNEMTSAEDWRWMQWAVPRPMYGLDRLQADRPVLIVEGEKCADAAHELLSDTFDVLSWPGGGKAVGKVDWSPLAGRKVLIWPDCDAQADKEGALLPEARQPGIVAAEAIAAALLEHGCKVRIANIPAPGDKPAGWDVADAIAEGMDKAAILAFLRDQRDPAACTREPVSPTPAARASAPPADRAWEAKLLAKRGERVSCLANIALVLSNREEWVGVIGHDAFSTRTMKRLPLPGAPAGDRPGEWSDVDTSRTIIWLTNEYGMTPGPAMVDEAVELIARANAFHPVREYLEGLAWDGIERLDDWLCDFMGVPKTEYTMRVARWFLTAMCARVMEPGCKFDYCLVLEGKQGRRKSSALRAMAGEWFSDTDLDLSNKDSMSALRGKWVHEVAEMGSLARAESARQKSFLSRQIDEFRPAYARREIRSPRQLVFAGTTNEWAWNKDPTGGRRFWPVEVGDMIDVEGLEAVRDQLFAEALVRYRAGERYWPTAQEQAEIFDPQQLARESEDGLFDLVHDWLEGLARPEFTMGEVLEEALKLDAGRITRDVTTRVGALLHKLGCGKRERRNGVTRFVYTVPKWSAFGKEAEKRQQLGASDGSALPL